MASNITIQESNHQLKVCIYCQDEFSSTDEIVVCRSCGAPYHKDCWLSINRCGVHGCTSRSYKNAPDLAVDRSNLIDSVVTQTNPPNVTIIETSSYRTENILLDGTTVDYVDTERPLINQIVILDEQPIEIQITPNDDTADSETWWQRFRKRLGGLF